LRHMLTQDNMLKNYAVMIWVMNFDWIVSLLWLGLTAWLLARHRVKAMAEELQTVRLTGLLFVCAVGIAFFFRPFSNPRYIIVPVILMLLATTYLVLTVVPSRNMRLAILVLLLGAFGMEDAWTVDPLSKAYFGTFRFGRHPMLTMSRPTGECGGASRDQLVYNLEFLKYAQLTRQMIKDVRPTPDTFILCQPAANWLLLPLLDDHTGKPTIDLRHCFAPHYTDIYVNPDPAKFQISGQAYTLSGLPKDIYYVDYPNFENQIQIEHLSKRYTQKTEKMYDMNGYQISLIHFTE
jgi:hypothetical protein